MTLVDALLLLLIIVTTLGFGLMFIMVLRNALAPRKPESLDKKS